MRKSAFPLVLFLLALCGLLIQRFTAVDMPRVVAGLSMSVDTSDKSLLALREDRKLQTDAKKVMAALQEEKRVQERMEASLRDLKATLPKDTVATAKVEPSKNKDMSGWGYSAPYAAAEAPSAPAPASPKAKARKYRSAPPVPSPTATAVPTATATPLPTPVPAKAPVDQKWIVSLIFSGIMLLASLWIILSKKYPDETAKWAYGTVGTLGGYWLAR